MSNVRNSTKVFLGIAAMILSVLYTLTAGGVFDFSGFYQTAFGIILGGVMLSEVAVAQYFNKSSYKSLAGRDFINFLVILFAAGVIMQALLFIPIIRESVAPGVLSFFGTVGVVVGVGAGLFSLMLLLTKDK